LAAVALGFRVITRANTEETEHVAPVRAGFFTGREIFPAGLTRLWYPARDPARGRGREAALIPFVMFTVGGLEIEAEAEENGIEGDGVNDGSFHNSILFSMPIRKHRPIKAMSSAQRRISGKDGKMVMAKPSKSD